MLQNVFNQFFDQGIILRANIVALFSRYIHILIVTQLPKKIWNDSLFDNAWGQMLIKQLSGRAKGLH